MVMGATKRELSGTRMMLSVNLSQQSSSPETTAMMGARRAQHSWMLPSILSLPGMLLQSATTGTEGSSRAMGPCLSSAAW